MQSLYFLFCSQSQWEKFKARTKQGIFRYEFDLPGKIKEKIQKKKTKKTNNKKTTTIQFENYSILISPQSKNKK